MWRIEQQWQRIADRVSVPVAYIDGDARVRFVNTAYARQFAGPPTQTVGQSLWDVIELPSVASDPMPAIRRGEAQSFLSRAQGNGGPSRDVWVNCIPHRAADGGGGCVVVLTDEHDADGSARGTDEVRTIVDATDALRELLCEELHDNVGQQLTGLELRVDALAHHVAGADRAVRELVAKIAVELKQAHTNIRQLVAGILPTAVPADGFVAELERFVGRIREYCGRTCELAVAGPVRVADEAAATHLFRIAQEAICNAIRHGQPTTIRVLVRGEHDALTVEVRDDGGGFSNRPDGVGLGLRLMHSRASRIGGTLTITTHDGGTVVAVRVPAAGDGIEGGRSQK